MDLDASKLKSPLIDQRRRDMRDHVNNELHLIKNKILLATRLGKDEIYYKVMPTFRYQDPTLVEEIIKHELQKKNFSVISADDYSLRITWGKSAGGVQAKTSS